MRIKFIQNLIDILRKKRKLVEFHYAKSYSQDGEDLILNSFLETNNKYKGFYVDIGACHPIILSNTYLFYQRGWRGINIDATPGSMNEFNKRRKYDINLEIGISDKEKPYEYYIFESRALNTFDKNIAEKRVEEGIKLLKTVKLQTTTINKILDKHLPENQKIDFITMDVEGKEFEIIKSLDFEKYAPKYFLIEDLNFESCDFTNYHSTEMYKYLSDLGYKLLGKTRLTLLFGK